jgi:NADP-dependent 3-hydroxy acid dehydrogenase YdfG
MAQQVKEMLGFGNEERNEQRNEQLHPRDQTIVITGAASGIGRECLRWFAREGYHCVGVDLKFGDFDEFIKSLSIGTGTRDNICLEECDVSNFEEFDRIVKKCEKKSGYISCLINNAGEKFLQTIDKQNPMEWQRMIDVNVMGVLNGTRCVVDKMKEYKTGCIINIGDIGGVAQFPNHTVYCATKCAVHGITEGLRRELMDSFVKVIGINPGAVETPMFTRSTNKNIESKDNKWKNSLKHGLLLPEDVARCCLFAYQQPKRCLIREIQLAPIEQHM